MRPELDNILRKAKKLASMTEDNGCTQNEAINAAEMLAQLLDEHNISMVDLSKADFKSQIKQEKSETVYKVVPGWKRLIGSYLAKCYEVKLIIQHPFERDFKATFAFIGLEADAFVASYFFDVLSNKLWYGGEAEAKRRQISGYNIGRFREGFIVGAMEEINKRLMARRKVEDAKPAEAGHRSTNAMIVVKQDAIKEYVAEHFPNLRKSTYNVGGTFEGRVAGKQFGSSVGLHEGVKNKSVQHARIA